MRTKFCHLLGGEKIYHIWRGGWEKFGSWPDVCTKYDQKQMRRAKCLQNGAS
jgi:hypothetical protein